jgi:hypothetical protein
MSIQKKSLISTLKSAKKANVVKEEVTASASVASPVKALRPALSPRTPKLSPRSHAPSKRTRSVRARMLN